MKQRIYRRRLSWTVRCATGGMVSLFAHVRYLNHQLRMQDMPMKSLRWVALILLVVGGLNRLLGPVRA